MTTSIKVFCLHVPRRPINAQDVQPCFGVACRSRGICACYDAVEGAPGGATARATCLSAGSYPGYRPDPHPLAGC